MGYTSRHDARQQSRHPQHLPTVGMSDHIAEAGTSWKDVGWMLTPLRSI